MPPIKKIKSNGAWTLSNFDFGPSKNSTEIINKPKMKKKIITADDDDDLDVVYCKIPKINDKKMNNFSAILNACEPKESSHLSVSKQKQNELADWLCFKTIRGKPRILVLSGPSGCGKTIALKVLAKESGFDVVEWITPMDTGVIDDYSSTRHSDKFFDFLIRTTRYNSVFNCNDRRLMLVKDIPNIYFFEKENFHNLLDQYMKMGREPLVFVVADSESSRVLYNLFPQDIIDKYEIDTINIPSTTPTAMKNMIKRISSILNKNAGHMLDIKQDNIDEVLSNSIGDVRSTIYNLIFSSLKVTNENLQKDCGSRGESLGLLHGIGRVINPKKINNGNEWKFAHNPDDIASYFQSQSSMFLYFLQENYINTISTIEEVDKCAEIMSLCDTFNSQWQDINLIKTNLSICIRGVMINNKNPVTKWNPVRKPKSDELKIRRDLTIAEENYYKKIINPKLDKNTIDPDNII
ncbi:cell cycle checkpoint protein RAD17, partial [Aphidius gifuensis]